MKPCCGQCRWGSTSERVPGSGFRALGTVGLRVFKVSRGLGRTWLRVCVDICECLHDDSIL